MTALESGRQRYGTFFTAPFIGGGVTCGGQDDLLWLFNNDAKSATDTAYGRRILVHCLDLVPLPIKWGAIIGHYDDC
jgi:hypothetical protein